VFLIDESIRVAALVGLSFGQQDSHSFFQNFKVGGISLLGHFFAQRAECIDVQHRKSLSLHFTHERRDDGVQKWTDRHYYSLHG